MQVSLCLLSGKLISQSTVAPAQTGSDSTTIYVVDRELNRRFLVDCGAQASLLPASYTVRTSGTTGPPLTAANGSPIPSYGTCHLTVTLEGRKYPQRFITAPVKEPILGADFLRTHKLLVALHKDCLIDSEDGSIIKGLPSRTSSYAINKIETNTSHFQQLLLDRPNLTTPAFHADKPAHGVTMHIPTSGPPLHSRARRLSPEKLAAAKAEFQFMEDLGIIRKSKSPWSSPLHLVPKKDGGTRPCGDYRRLNAVTTSDRYPIPYLSDAHNFLEGKTVFSKIDLIKSYYQIPVAPEDIPKTAVITPFGLYEWCRTPFGLRNAAQAFMRLMHQVAGDLDFIFIYLDDILVASSSLEEHYQHLQQLFDRLQEHGLVVNPDKCVFAASNIDFLGHHISSAGSKPLPEKVAAIRNFPRPSTVQGLQQFLGMLNFYNRYIKGISITLAPLFHAIAGKTSKSTVEWTPLMDTAFNNAKAALASTTLLSHPSLTAPTALTTDASDTGIGAVLEQYTKGSWKPLAFFSKSLSTAEQKYSAYDKELLAIHRAIRHFRQLLEGRNFTVFTDHKPLVTAISKATDPLSARQQRHLAAISEFTTDIKHVEGRLNPVADALSRHPQPPSPSPSLEDVLQPPVISAASTPWGTDLVHIGQTQALDDDLQAFIASGTHKLHLEQVHLPDHHQTVWCEMSRPAPRPLVPENLRQGVFQHLHGLAHPGVKASTRLVKDRFFWPGLAKDVKIWTTQCIPCQRSKVIRHVRPPLQYIDMPSGRFQHVHVDLVGPLPPSQGATYLLTMVDRFTRWPEAVPISDIKVSTVASAFTLNWVGRHGVPLVITSDRGTQFTSGLWTQMSQSLGCKLLHTTAYHPQSNGLVERMHRRLKEALKTRLVGPDWVGQLPWVLLGLRATIKEDLGCSPAEMVFGSPLSVPGDCLPTVTAPTESAHLAGLRQQVSQLQPVPTSHHRPPQQPTFLPSNTEFVFVRRDGYKPPLCPAYDGPYKVISMTDNVVTISRNNGPDTVSSERCKPAILDREWQCTLSGDLIGQQHQPPAQPQQTDRQKPCPQPSLVDRQLPATGQTARPPADRQKPCPRPSLVDRQLTAAGQTSRPPAVLSRPQTDNHQHLRRTSRIGRPPDRLGDWDCSTWETLSKGEQL